MKIGFIGLGIMGKPMVRNLLKAGHEVWVNNRSKAPMEELVKDGISGTYLARHRAGLFPTSYDFDENGWPIEKRTAYHMSMRAEIINTFDQMYPDKPLKISGLPDANEMIANGLEATLKSLA